MIRFRLTRLSLFLAGLMVAMAAAFWCWAVVAGWLDLGSRWPGGARVTATLWTLFLVGVPAAGLLALVTGLLAAFRRRQSWLVAAIIGAMVVATGAFWLWSLLSAGM